MYFLRFLILGHYEYIHNISGFLQMFHHLHLRQSSGQTLNALDLYFVIAYWKSGFAHTKPTCYLEAKKILRRIIFIIVKLICLLYLNSYSC